jgi:predicted methyltransferase MtxX (methanogen marker protein 4)
MGELAQQLGYHKILRVAIIRDVKNREFLLVPAAVAEGNTIGERLFMAREAAAFLRSIGIMPKVAVGQIWDYRNKNDEITQSIDEAEYLAEKLREDSIAVPFVGYNLETAVDSCNVIVPRNGIIGNAVWRMITGVGGCKDLGDFGLIREVFVDDSQYWDDYYDAIKFAVALANARGTR